MFDIGFWELSLIGVLGLVILGPERLPMVARTVGSWVRRGRRVLRGFGEEVTGDSSVSELRDEVQRMRSDFETDARGVRDDVERMGETDASRDAATDAPDEDEVLSTEAVSQLDAAEIEDADPEPTGSPRAAPDADSAGDDSLADGSAPDHVAAADAQTGESATDTPANKQSTADPSATSDQRA